MIHLDFRSHYLYNVDNQESTRGEFISCQRDVDIWGAHKKYIVPDKSCD